MTIKKNKNNNNKQEILNDKNRFKKIFIKRGYS